MCKENNVKLDVLFSLEDCWSQVNCDVFEVLDCLPLITLLTSLPGNTAILFVMKILFQTESLREAEASGFCSRTKKKSYKITLKSRIIEIQFIHQNLKFA